MTLSLVSPEDMPHHAAICAAQGMKLLPLYKAELYLLPKLSERVDLAKKVPVTDEARVLSTRH